MPLELKVCSEVWWLQEPGQPSLQVLREAKEEFGVSSLLTFSNSCFPKKCSHIPQDDAHAPRPRALLVHFLALSLYPDPNLGLPAQCKDSRVCASSPATSAALSQVLQNLKLLQAVLGLPTTPFFRPPRPPSYKYNLLSFDTCLEILTARTSFQLQPPQGCMRSTTSAINTHHVTPWVQIH